MEDIQLESIFVYSINNKNKVIGKLKNVSKKESLKNIRPKIKKMTLNDEFVKPINDKYDIFDKDLEEDFVLKDILIEENEIYKIYIKESDIENIIQENNVNTNFVLQNYNIINNKNTLEKKSSNPVSQNNENAVKNNLNQNNINFNNMHNNIGNINYKVNNNIENRSNNMNNNMIPKINKVNNNLNNMPNNIMNINIIKNNNMSNMNNNNLINQNNQNIILNKLNYQMNDDFIIKYNITFRTNNGINYTITKNGRTKIDTLIYTYESKMSVFSALNMSVFSALNQLSYFYKGQQMIINEMTSIKDYFQNEKNPIIFVKDFANIIGKLIPITFKITNNGDSYHFIFNSNSNINNIVEVFFAEISSININPEFIYNGPSIIFNPEFIYNGKIIKFVDENISIGGFFNNDNNPIIFVNNINNLIGKKIKVDFQTNRGYKHELIINNKKSIIDLFRAYFEEIDDKFNFNYNKFDFNFSVKPYDNLSKIINNIIFEYNGKQIKYMNIDYRMTIDNYFQNDKNPKIYVNDIYNLLLIN